MAMEHQPVPRCAQVHPRSIAVCMRAGNVLLCTSSTEHGFSAKVADFGMCRREGMQQAHREPLCGTYTYMAPEVLQGRPFTQVRRQRWHSMLPLAPLPCHSCQGASALG